MTSTFLFGAGKVGAIPLAVAFHKTQSEQGYTIAFEMIKKALGPSAFGGKGFPSSFRIDDSRAEYNALHKVWPEIEIYLCTFHVLQSVWRWLWDSKSAIDKDHRQHLILLFRQLVYSKTSIEFEEFCSSMLSDGTVQRYQKFESYVREQWLQRKELWAICFRSSSLTRGNHTNNYVESAIRIFKEIILVRCKAFNVVALVEFVVNNLERYHCTRLLKFATFGSAKLELEFRKFNSASNALKVEKINTHAFLVSSSKDDKILYQVNILSETCDCFRGQFGHFCKHLFAVSDFEKCSLYTSPKIYYEDKIEFATLALGHDKVDHSFYRSMQDNDGHDAMERPSQQSNGTDETTQSEELVCSTTVNVDGKTEDLEKIRGDLEAEIQRYQDQQNRIVTLLKNCGPSTYSLKILRQANATLKDLNTQDGVIQFMKNCTSVTTAVRRGKKIAVNSTSICRRVSKSDGTRYGGSSRLSSGRKPGNNDENLSGPPRPKKRRRCLAENIYLNQPNGKPHGSRH